MRIEQHYIRIVPGFSVIFCHPCPAPFKRFLRNDIINGTTRHIHDPLQLCGFLPHQLTTHQTFHISQRLCIRRGQGQIDSTAAVHRVQHIDAAFPLANKIHSVDTKVGGKCSCDQRKLGVPYCKVMDSFTSKIFRICTSMGNAVAIQHFHSTHQAFIASIQAVVIGSRNRINTDIHQRLHQHIRRVKADQFMGIAGFRACQRRFQIADHIIGFFQNGFQRCKRGFEVIFPVIFHLLHKGGLDHNVA